MTRSIRSGLRPVLWSVTRSSFVWRCSSIRSMAPCSLNPPSTVASCATLCASRAPGTEPKANSNITGVHSSPSRARYSSQAWRSRRIEAISSFQTRSTAGARLSCSAAAISPTTRSSTARAAARPAPVTGSAAGGLQVVEEPFLDRVEDAAARQRIHALQRLRLLERPQPVDRAQHELVRAGAEPLQAGQRVGARGQAVRRQRLDDPRRDARQPVAGRPPALAARPAVDDRAAQVLVEPQQVVRVPFHRLPVRLVEQPAQHGQVVLLVVDRLFRQRSAPARRASRCRPARARSSSVSWSGTRPVAARMTSSP